jgi:hypothetical protein
VERDPSFGIAELPLLLADQADVDDSAATDVGEHVLQIRQPRPHRAPPTLWPPLTR